MVRSKPEGISPELLAQARENPSSELAWRYPAVLEVVAAWPSRLLEGVWVGCTCRYHGAARQISHAVHIDLACTAARVLQCRMYHTRDRRPASRGSGELVNGIGWAEVARSP